MSTKNVRHLRENGPATGEELPGHNITIADREAGAWKFQPHGTVGGREGKRSMVWWCVYYLKDVHQPEEVVKKWLEVNWRGVQGMARRAVRSHIKDVGTEFEEAVDSLIPAQPNEQSFVDQKGGFNIE
jgi:hypothetical protein